MFVVYKGVACSFRDYNNIKLSVSKATYSVNRARRGCK